MRTRLALLATSALAAMAVATPAEAAGGSWYASLTGGANWLNDNRFAVATPTASSTDAINFNSDSETGYVIAGAVGYSLGGMVPGLRVEAEVAYRQNQVDGLWSTFESGSSTTLDSGTLEYDHTSFSVLANAWYDFDFGTVKPYIGGGIGWADVEVDGAYTSALLLGPAVAIDVSDSGFAWQAGAGVNFQVAPNIQLGVGYRYYKGPDVTVAAPNVNNPTSGDLEDDNHSGVVTLTFGL